ncbi:hypothetical protein POVWA2_031710 [Plasmodium ovale wallikeri]|uniref:Uncharacterized protein n=1 Tax=Plasmodium ovale wallikeri TaxID=864142 RepID=A0A1A8YY06_PLAOA|nr:hypothetical protein POVWA1_031990 [Plasmodium ovale wallikeri]SBT36739.1 hypothetical protein POVWA2_031710 [Plasmodium ovale wallikeri]
MRNGTLRRNAKREMVVKRHIKWDTKKKKKSSVVFLPHEYSYDMKKWREKMVGKKWKEKTSAQTGKQPG